METKIEIKSPPVNIKGVEISSLQMNQTSFEGFVEATNRAQVGAKTQHAITRNIWRERIKMQVVATGKDGKTHSFDDESYAALHGSYAIKLRNILTKLDEDAKEAGKIIEPGDGISTPILFQLGTPIKLSADKAITELEILMENMAALEDFLTVDNPLLQAMEIIKRAKPIGQDVKLITMPSAAVSKISIRDGMTIVNEVVPKILGEESE